MSSFFRFKQFSICHDQCAMKVNTDGVLLGAWVRVDAAHSQRVLDVGTGSGLIAIMLAQRCPSAQIDAVELDESSCRQAVQNAASCPWSERLHMVCADFNIFAQQADMRYDLIVSNPPYFSQSLCSPDVQRNAVRHNLSLEHDDLVMRSKNLLTPQGRLALVLPYVEGSVLVAHAATFGLYCCRKLNVSTKKGRPPKRLLLELSAERQPCDEQDFFIENEALNSYTEAYKILTGDFYLNFFR
ncbi:MAG: methyltransferase [Prevotellaceae bacterium]|jgi:tRNA1Val (adenine37-N6)-methyltransferase|nr:methyltransferase [Prevotellaceae bacterium]